MPIVKAKRTVPKRKENLEDRIPSRAGGTFLTQLVLVLSIQDILGTEDN